MYMYKMKDEQDYRIAVNGVGHGVVLIKRENDIDTAFGYFKSVDDDMILVSEQEENEINTSLNTAF
ncbi:hypothetical protein [Sulfurospirillum multivorans]|uniref:Uncharacterized protein n=2 Tax=Sulfurospirillum multivorans TaxID=66821 RepID=A0AA86AP86_SULMK|nr:hypothetical protein [Sulfurospirillum multivorans]AHJ12342.1 hypothetical protein SMUL_1076 [Sulfurospirillum multivorans DSM 12446]AHJ13252.1 hypothetical protein SMUL_1997 [Sulfurospirillum multivorans DSM 12446]QEH06741.1 hypothetical protein SMN_1976 [Sulfurospirillum multivorans]